MKRIRMVCAALLAIVCCTALLTASNVYAGTKYTLAEANIPAGSTILWQPTNNTSGFSLTNGGTQGMDMYFSTSGNVLTMGFEHIASGRKPAWFQGTVSSTSKSVSKMLTDISGYYKPYVDNNNSSVSITVKNTSSVTVD